MKHFPIRATFVFFFALVAFSAQGAERAPGKAAIASARVTAATS
jgi:hypothetical protein